MAVEALKTAATTTRSRIHGTVTVEVMEKIVQMDFHGLQDLIHVASAKENSDLPKLWVAI